MGTLRARHNNHLRYKPKRYIKPSPQIVKLNTIPLHIIHADLSRTLISYISLLRYFQPVGKWGDISSLVNLGSISKNEALVAKQAQQAAVASNYTPSSFSGLDGFSKPQSMVRFFVFYLSW
jgi:hypothetical protein